MMALVFLGGGTLLTALSFQVLVPSEEKNLSAWSFFFIMIEVLKLSMT